MRFALRDDTLTPLWDSGWFSVSRFSMSEDHSIHDERDIVGGFLTSPLALRRFCAQPDPWGVAPGHHGPFLQDRIDLAWLTRLGKGELLSRLKDIYRSPEFTSPPDPGQWSVVEAWATTIETSSAVVFALDGPEQGDARVEWDVWLLFKEFAVVDRRHEALAIAVLGYD